MDNFILEACVDSVESAMAAVRGGATRLELCGSLVIGGTTPNPWLFKEIRRLSEDSGNVMRSGELSDAAICGSVCRDGPKPGYWCGSHAGVPDRYTAGV